MKKELNIGNIKIPNTSATKGFGFIGKRGSGKSYGAAVFAEELYAASIPFVVFDPIDVWWGLKVAADGKGKGLPVVVFGKEHADIQLDRGMGRKIAEAVVKDNISCIISTFGMNKTEMREIITDFSERLLQINNTPRQVLIEEAHEYVPQRVQGGATKCFAAVEALLVMGRNRGIGVTLLNQRMATLNKDLLTQIDVLVAFRSVGPQDRKAFKDWVEVHNDENDDNFDEFMKSVPGLPTGEAWVWSPEFLEIFKRVKFRKRHTFHPDREKLGMTFKMPEIKQGDVQAFIDSFSKKPEPKKAVYIPTAKDGAKVSSVNIEKEKRDAYNRGVFDGTQKGRQEGAEIVQKGFDVTKKKIVDALMRVHGDVNKTLELLGSQPDKVIDLTKISPKQVRSMQKAIDDAFIIPSASDNSVVSRPEQKILDAILWMHAIGQEQPRKEAVALLAGVRPTSGGFKNTCGQLRSKGLVDYPTAGTISLTAAGNPIAQPPGIMYTDNESFHREILSKLSQPEQNVLKPLLYTRLEMTKDELARETPYQPTSGGFKNILGTLRTMGLIDYPHPGTVKAEPLMFPFDN